MIEHVIYIILVPIIAILFMKHLISITIQNRYQKQNIVCALIIWLGKQMIEHVFFITDKCFVDNYRRNSCDYFFNF